MITTTPSWVAFLETWIDRWLAAVPSPPDAILRIGL
jgi:hypothetical protein